LTSGGNQVEKIKYQLLTKLQIQSHKSKICLIQATQKLHKYSKGYDQIHQISYALIAILRIQHGQVSLTGYSYASIAVELTGAWECILPLFDPRN